MTKRLLKHLRTKIFAGILVILPIGITFLVLSFVFNTLDRILSPLVPEVEVSLFHHVFALPGMGIITFVVLLYLVGVITTNVLGRKLVGWADRMVINIPVVKKIYLASKQLTEAFSPARRGTFRQAVLVEFPEKENFVLGFVTNELGRLVGEKKVSVFIPTAFVPPQGFLLFLPKAKVYPSNLTIEEAIKTIMSVGIVTPQNLAIPEPGTKVLKETVENVEAIKPVGGEAPLPEGSPGEEGALVGQKA
jgi:uncharacterized membrane protein